MLISCALRVYVRMLQGAALAKAKLMNPSLPEQYNIFKLEQMEVERMATQDNDNTMDMAGYAEFQRQFKGLKEAHRQVLYAIRAFWQSLTRSDIKYTTLVNHFSKMGTAQTLVRALCELSIIRSALTCCAAEV